MYNIKLIFIYRYNELIYHAGKGNREYSKVY